MDDKFAEFGKASSSIHVPHIHLQPHISQPVFISKQEPTTPIMTAKKEPVSPPPPTATNVPPLPERPKPEESKPESPKHAPIPSPSPTPLLRLEVKDLSHPGARSFLSLHNAYDLFSDAIDQIMIHLYAHPKGKHVEIPPTRSVTVIIRDMPGVAHTTGKDIDPSHHKEIHLSASYVANVPDLRRKDEIRGVMIHELVHCFQFDAKGTCSGGLVEGIADYVRLKAGCAPPHWKKSWDGDATGGGGWDRGYERTAYFLEWVESKLGKGLIIEMNQWLRKKEKYTEDEFWKECCGKSVEEWWKAYGEECEKSKS